MELSRFWHLSTRADRRALPLADRHYNRQKVGSPQFVPPGRCLVLLTEDASALWVTTWPFARFVKHRWAGAWVNSLFRRESGPLASDLIRDAVAVTLGRWPEPPPQGIVSFVDAGKTRRKRDVGRCYLRAGWRYAGCHRLDPSCAECQARVEKRGSAAKPCGLTQEEGLYALQLLPADMPQPLQYRPRLDEPGMRSQPRLGWPMYLNA
jgi:hypothetical protein